MSVSSESNLGDFLKAIKILKPESEKSFSAIAKLFGYGWRSDAQDGSELKNANISARILPETSQNKAKRGRGKNRSAAPELELPKNVNIVTKVERLSTTPFDYEWLDDSLPELPVESEKSTENDDATFLSLLEPTQERALLTEILSAAVPGSQINIPKLLAKLSNLDPVYKLPYLTRRSLSQGVEILVDRAEFMTPFYKDQEVLLKSVKAYFTDSRVRVFYFDSNPLSDEDSESYLLWDWKPWRVPRKPKTLLLLTDFGLLAKDWKHKSYIEYIKSWAKFAEMARKAGCPVISLVPYSRKRWPPGIEQLFPIMEWNRKLNMPIARRALGRRWEETG